MGDATGYTRANLSRPGPRPRRGPSYDGPTGNAIVDAIRGMGGSSLPSITGIPYATPLYQQARDKKMKSIDGSEINLSQITKSAPPESDLTDKMLQQIRKAEALRTKLGRTRQSAMTRDTLLGGG